VFFFFEITQQTQMKILFPNPHANSIIYFQKME